MALLFLFDTKKPSPQQLVRLVTVLFVPNRVYSKIPYSSSAGIFVLDTGSALKALGLKD